MKVLSTLFWFNILLLVHARGARNHGFETYQSQFLAEGSLKLSDATYDELTVTSRNYTTIILLTALEARFGCQLCKDFQPEWDLLGKSWARGDKRGSSRTILGTLDFIEGKNTFQKLMLQTAPVVLLFPPTIGSNSKPDGLPIRYDFTAGAQSAEQIRAWITRHLPDGPIPAVIRPFNYVRILVLFTSILAVVSIFGVAHQYIVPVIQNRNLWAGLSLLMILMFTSGHMFNHIRKVPYVAGDGHGGISYFAGGFSNQFGMETQIVAAIYGVLSFATIALALKVPRMMDPKQQQVAVFVWGGIMLGLYSFLMSIFRIKNGGYPFHLPPF